MDSSSPIEETSSHLRKLLSSRAVHSLIGIVISVLLLLWVFSEIDFNKVREPLLSAHYWVLVPSFFILLFHFFLRAWRWSYLLPNGDKTTLLQRFDGVMVGNFANFVLPLRAGEFVRPFLLSKLTRISFAEGFSSIVTERFFDLTAAIVSFAIIVPQLSSVPGWVSTSVWALGGVAIGIFGFILFVIFAPSVVRRTFDFFFPSRKSPFGEKLRMFLEDFIASARILANPKRLTMVLFLTICIWASSFYLFTVFLSLLEIESSFLVGTTVGVVIALAVAAPSAPGFIGVYQTACLASFTLFGLSDENAFVYSIITHVFQYVIYIGFGWFAISRAGLRFSELRKRSQESLEEL